jgi:methionyl aminopeptidase
MVKMITIKTKEEIEIIRRNGKIVAETLDLLHKSTVPGISTIELNNIAETFIGDSGAMPATFTKGFPKAICISINEEIVHGIPSDQKLKEGDIVTFDVCILKDGFCADAAITVPVGNVSDSAKRLIDVCNQSLGKGIEKAVAGNRINDISTTIYNYVRSSGFDVIRDYGGHGIGRELHEDPFVPNCWCDCRGAGNLLLEGMTFTIEPMICIGKRTVKLLDNGWTIVIEDGSLSAHCEHTIVVVNGKPEILTMK